ncbi:hypothetical protein H0E87_007817 [Populus deltoides]|uniref:TF-B3 domain-containing protein n=1 Tax=Populus deltoides TaxID=3696 RepID=A0A8T2YY88_POPDE|nr:hypothetical protein H0E87_007817 [Populus deltoides]
MEHLFTKLLSPTDTTHRLTIPAANLGDFEFPMGEHAIDIEATDTIERQWIFRLSIRRDNNPNPRPVFTGQWTQFVNEKALGWGIGLFSLGNKLKEIAKAVSFTVRNVLLLEIGGGGGLKLETRPGLQALMQEEYEAALATSVAIFVAKTKETKREGIERTAAVGRKEIEEIGGELSVGIGARMGFLNSEDFPTAFMFLWPLV